MTERGNDIEFDFFEEPATQEAPARSRPARRGPRRPQRPPAGLTPLLRLVGLIAFAILIVVLLVFWVQSCRDESKRSEYSAYMGQVREVANDSTRIGQEFNVLLTTPGIKQAELVQQLGGLAQQQEQGVAKARDLQAPAPLRGEHQHGVEALQFRVSGLRRLQDAFRQAADSKDAAAAGQLLAEQVERLVASDVIWEDLFREPAVQELRRQDIGGVEVPVSVFVTNPALASQQGMRSIWQRIQSAATGGTPSGLHGNAIAQVRALPDGPVLRSDQDNTVTATADLAFEVTVENSGDFQEVQVVVRLTIQQSPSPITKQATIDLIDPDQRKTVVFRQLGQIVQFAQKTNVKVQVQPVRGEKNVSNNTASFPVIFTLTPP